MPFPADVNVQYPQNMFEGITQNSRPYYEPALHQAFVRNAIYNNFVKQDFNHNGVKATEMYIDQMIAPHANHSPISNYQAWGDTSYTDSFRRKITFKRYFGKLSLNKYDDMISFWEQNGQPGLLPIISSQIGPMMTQTLEKVARDAFLDAPFKFFKPDGSGSSFASIGTGDTATAQMIKDIQLGLDYRENDQANNFDPAYPSTWCITTPGVIDDIRNEAMTSINKGTWQGVNEYTGEGRATKMKGEVGMFYGVRFLKSPSAVLWNAGTQSVQTTITAPVAAGDGSPDPSSSTVDGVEYVGQPGATHSIPVATVVGFAVGDIVTIHKLRTSSFGITTTGLDYRDGSAVNLRIVAITGGTPGTLVFERPIMENFLDVLTAGVYGYVTKGRHIHSMSFIYGDDAVVRGVQRPPEFYTPASIDDTNQIRRFTWDAHVGYVPFNKNAFEVGFCAGSIRHVGARKVQ